MSKKPDKQMIESLIDRLFAGSMTNVHDVFYPSETRLHSLVVGGEYFVS